MNEITITGTGLRANTEGRYLPHRPAYDDPYVTWPERRNKRLWRELELRRARFYALAHGTKETHETKAT